MLDCKGSKMSTELVKDAKFIKEFTKMVSEISSDSNRAKAEPSETDPKSKYPPNPLHTEDGSLLPGAVPARTALRGAEAVVLTPAPQLHSPILVPTVEAVVVDAEVVKSQP